MPYVHIDWVKGNDQSKKDELAKRVTSAVTEVTGIPGEAIWVVFQEVEDTSWYVGARTVQAIRAESKE